MNVPAYSLICGVEPIDATFSSCATLNLTLYSFEQVEVIPRQILSFLRIIALLATRGQRVLSTEDSTSESKS